MSDDGGGEVRFDGGPGIVATHPTQEIHPVLVAPSTAPEQFNRIEEDLIPVACVLVNHSNFGSEEFEFDRSFISPEISEQLAHIARLRDDLPGMPISIFGHADPTGDDGYNKKLSGRRAQAVYGLLTRRTDLWEDLYTNPAGGDEWGVRSLQIMLRELGKDPGPADGVMGDLTCSAVKDFQTENELDVDGDPGPKTRAQLFGAYMDQLAGDLKLSATDFLAQGADPDGRGDFQGCGEFNPSVVLPRAVQDGDKSARDSANRPNRRVLVFFFRRSARVSPERWPCSSVKEGSTACRTRHFSDGESRREVGDTERKYEDTQDTFACRFYDRLARRSPCEGGVPAVDPWKNVLEIYLYDDRARQMSGTFYRVLSGGAKPQSGRTRSDGFIRLDLPPICTERIEIQWGSKAQEGPFLYTRSILVNCDKGDENQRDKARMHNIGYDAETDFDGAARTFQSDYQVDCYPFPVGLVNGALPAASRKRLNEIFRDPGCGTIPPSTVPMGAGPPTGPAYTAAHE